MKHHGNCGNKKGFTLITMAFAIFLVLGFTGLAVDIGHMYIAKNEAQAFADAAALAAAQYLDGTVNGINNARNAASAMTDKYDLGTKAFASSNLSIAFSLPATVTTSGGTTTKTYDWQANPNPATGFTMVRVVATAPTTIWFARAISSVTSSNVAAQAIAGQMPVQGFTQGVFPFSPFAHLKNLTRGFQTCSGTKSNGCMDAVTGLIVGSQYTLRWPSNPNPNGGNSNMCPGDKANGDGPDMVTIANAAGGSERGYIEDTSASLIAQTIIDDLQTVTREVGDLVTMTGGAKQSQLDSLRTRLAQDIDTSSTNSSAYFANTHNNRRVVACLINDGKLVNGNQYTTLQLGAFLLLPSSEYGNGGNQSWCAEYLGPYVQGGKSSGAGASGAYDIRLVE